MYLATIASTAEDPVSWQRFDRNGMRARVAEGKTVLVYVTADWCVTCKVNDRTTFSDQRVIDTVNDRAVAMKADWTRPDEVISDFLEENGRYGIPFTVVYSKRNPDGKILPELLTPTAVLDAIGPPETTIK
jgi:suppressor for copper-sensitivity B